MFGQSAVSLMFLMTPSHRQVTCCLRILGRRPGPQGGAESKHLADEETFQATGTAAEGREAQVPGTEKKVVLGGPG